MSKKPSGDILDEMTKEELVAWIRRAAWGRPKRSEILFLRWDRQSLQLQEDRESELKILHGIDFEERGRIWEKYNQATTAKEKLRLLGELEKFNAHYEAHQKRYRAIERRQAKVDALYEQIDVARQAE